MRDEQDMNPYEPPLASTEPEIEGGTCYRISPGVWQVAMGTSFAFIGLAVLVGVVADIDVGTIPLIMVLLGLSLIGPLALARYKFDRLWLTPDAIFHFTLFNGKGIRFREVTCVEWRSRPSSGTVVVCHPAMPIKLYLGDYDQQDQQAIISHLRENIPHDRQTGWR